MAKILDYEQYLIFLRESKASEPLRLVRKLRGGGGGGRRGVYSSDFLVLMWGAVSEPWSNFKPIPLFVRYAYIAYIEQYSTG